MADEVHVHDAEADTDEAGEAIHLPGPSYQPVALAFGLTLAITGVVIYFPISVIGLVITLVFDSRTDAPGTVPLAMGQTAEELREASVAGFRAGMLVAAALAFAGAAVGAFWISNREARVEQAQPVSEQAPAPAGS